MTLGTVETHWPAGPNGCCCPSSPNISLKSSSSFPGQFAVVIGFDSSGFTPPLDRRPLEQFTLYPKVSQHLPTATADAKLQLFVHWIRELSSPHPPPPPSSDKSKKKCRSLVFSSSPAVNECNSGFNFRESRLPPSVSTRLTTSLCLPTFRQRQRSASPRLMFGVEMINCHNKVAVHLPFSLFPSLSSYLLLYLSTEVLSQLLLTPRDKAVPAVTSADTTQHRARARKHTHTHISLAAMGLINSYEITNLFEIPKIYCHF